ncbi:MULTISPECIES: phosphate regulon transcriptional regulator PhoB [Paraburkholderia]|uniref:Phosphate regulon transcriptional regulatory protein PhoB n=1 Tax=Paraburkholderia podalyriae TaxID=1938811 RepID=A0ABR7Q016_9BURK|nr:phosphate regulon transcriptional regulator PhoB [Paraburkholderia podalyriae]MBC8751873.1 phosphate regulon transcriptional regulatory protein PhoB [Paraburkholderia podalyriae]
MPATVLIVEDEPAIAELLAVNIKHAGYHPLQARDADAAKALVDEVLPDLIVLDWMLPGTSGLVFLRRLRADSRTRAVPVIMLTARTQEEDSVSGFEAGADDYMAKPFSPKELVARIKAVLRRRAPELSNEAVTINGLTLDPSTRRVCIEHDGAELPVHLGPSEFKLLHFFLAHPERVHSRSLLLQHVWGNHASIEERTVDVHIKRLRSALKPVGYESIIETVRGSGYMLSKTAQPHGMENAA